MTITKESGRVEYMGVVSSSCFGSLQSTMSKDLQVASKLQENRKCTF